MVQLEEYQRASTDPRYPKCYRTESDRIHRKRRHEANDPPSYSCPSTSFRISSIRRRFTPKSPYPIREADRKWMVLL